MEEIEAEEGDRPQKGREDRHQKVSLGGNISSR